MADAGLLLTSFIVPFAIVMLATSPFGRYLTRLGRTVEDVHKNPPYKVPSPLGPILFAGSLAGEVAAFALSGSLVPVAVGSAAAVAFAVGIVDDLYVLGGKTKPVLLLFAGVPLVLLAVMHPNLYEPSLTFPILGDTSPHFTIYTVLAIVAFPIVANAFNMMDSFNGQISWFTVLSSAAVLFGVSLHAIYVGGFSSARVAATLPLVATGCAFLVFNRFPSKAFDGDSGSLMLGSMYAALAVTGGVEVAAMIAILPAILNSFYTLSSVRGFVERRSMRSRPTFIGEDGLLHASPDGAAPNTLVRLVLLGGPLSEVDLVKNVVWLTAFACGLSVLISILTWVI